MMDPILYNPGFQHIGESIFMHLDNKQLQALKLVNHCWKNFLDNPRFWFKKCIQSGLSMELQTEWNKLIQLLQGTNLEKNLTLCLIKMHYKDSWYFTSPLRWISKVGDLALVQVMFEHKQLFQINCLFKEIYVAASNGHTEIVKALVAGSDKPNVHHMFGWTPMHNAALYGHTEVVKFLLSVTKNTNPPSHALGQTPMHSASMNGHTETVKALMACTDDPNASDNLGRTPMHEAAANGHTEVVKALVTYIDNPNPQDNLGRTPIYVAARNGHTEVVKTLLAHTENPNVTDDTFGRTPIHEAASNGHIETLKVLVDYSENPNVPDNFGKTPIHLATKNGHTQIVKFLKSKNKKCSKVSKRSKAS